MSKPGALVTFAVGFGLGWSAKTLLASSDGEGGAERGGAANKRNRAATPSQDGKSARVLSAARLATHLQLGADATAFEVAHAREASGASTGQLTLADIEGFWNSADAAIGSVGSSFVAAINQGTPNLDGPLADFQARVDSLTGRLRQLLATLPEVLAAYGALTTATRKLNQVAGEAPSATSAINKANTVVGTLASVVKLLQG